MNNKASGKLAAGVRKMKTQQKPPVDDTTAANDETPARPPVVTSSQPVAAPRVVPTQALHPERVWPD